MNIRKTYYNKTRNRKISKTILYTFILLSTLVCCFYEHYNYSKLLDSFKTNFNDYKFSEANNLLLTRQNFNPFKLFSVNKDVSKYFNNKINTLSNDMENKKISPEDALLQLKEIKRYNIISDDELHNISISINLIKDSNKNYTDALNYFNNGQYVEAISCLKKVSALDLNYPESLTYIDKSKSALKDSLFNYCDTLVDNDHYTEALSKISDNNNILGDDADIESKINDIKTKQQEYLDKNSAVAEASSRALTTAISPSNINTLNIQSDTSYFINVNIKNQKTYIYKGKADNWKLVETYSCSTGITGEDTPSGSFSIKEKGDWFFSEKYDEGGKYWTQITGDILFHSVPFDKDKTTVLDYTMNKPSSHGCIRLSLDDAKWIYNNIPKGSKVIIK